MTARQLPPPAPGPDPQDAAIRGLLSHKKDYDAALDRLDPQRVPPALHRLAGAWDLVHRLEAEIDFYDHRRPLTPAQEKHLTNMLALLPEAEAEWQEEVKQWQGDRHG